MDVLNETTANLDKPGQMCHLQRTYRGQGHTVRVIVTTSSFGPSYYLAEVWTGEGWKQVARILDGDPTLHAPDPYLPAHRRHEVKAGVERIAQRLLDDAMTVLATGPVGP